MFQKHASIKNIIESKNINTLCLTVEVHTVFKSVYRGKKSYLTLYFSHINNNRIACDKSEFEFAMAWKRKCAWTQVNMWRIYCMIMWKKGMNVKIKPHDLKYMWKVNMWQQLQEIARGKIQPHKLQAKNKHVMINENKWKKYHVKNKTQWTTLG